MTTGLAPSVKDRVAALLWGFQDLIALNDNNLIMMTEWEGGHMQLMILCFSTIQLFNEDALKMFHKPWQGSFKVVEVLGQSVYRNCANPNRRKIVPFKLLKPAPGWYTGTCTRTASTYGYSSSSLGEPDVLEADPPDQETGDHVEDIQPPIATVKPKDRQPVNGPAPDVPKSMQYYYTRAIHDLIKIVDDLINCQWFLNNIITNHTYNKRASISIIIR